MAVKTYQHAHGRLVSEKTTGGSRKDYLTDALGSVTCVTDTSGDTLETIRNAAYGKRVSGAAPTVTRTWAGTWGYAQTGLAWADVSLPYRHYSSQTTRWTTADPLWPDEGAYLYVRNCPTLHIDFLGTEIVPLGCDVTGITKITKAREICRGINLCMKNPECRCNLYRCIGTVKPDGFLDQVIKRLVEACTGKGDRNCIICVPPRECVGQCGDKRNGIVTYAFTGVYNETNPLKFPSISPTWRGEDIQQCSVPDRTSCIDALRSLGAGNKCDCVTVLCKPADGMTIVHELLHCVGIKGATNHNSVNNDFVYRLESCFKNIDKNGNWGRGEIG